MSEPITVATMPPGDYAIVEFFGHTTMVGRVSEVEKFGSKMLVLEPLFNGHLLSPVMHGGASIYRLTPCSPEIALERAPSSAWALPGAIRATIPPLLLEHDFSESGEEED
ncbi:MAG: hypothetical protein KGL63_05025 [Betaproteobacteria bacterium]|nr:hypothetical protein [Betaproteobacteria bacterium]